MQTGDLIADRYELIRLVHSTWHARDQISSNLCLLKPADRFVDPEVADWLGCNWHIGLPRLLDRVSGPVRRADGAAARDDCDFYVFEYRVGQTLQELARANQGRLSPLPLLPMMVQVAGLLAYLHQQSERAIVHLDIKPEHLVMEAGGQVSLVDFGAARMLPPRSQSPADGHSSLEDRNLGGLVALTPEFAAPELYSGNPCPGSDIFALGLVILHLLSGQAPEICKHRPIQELLPAASPGLQRLLASCLLADPRQRLADIHDLQMALQKESEQASEAGLLADAGLFVEEAGICEPCGLVADAWGEQAVGSPVIAEQASGQEKAERPASVDARLICVWDCPEFGCELAGVLAEHQDVLVIDADLFNPQADLLLGRPGKAPAPLGRFSPGGLDLALAGEQRGQLDASSLAGLAQPTRLKRVRLLSTQLNLDHYDYLDLDSLNLVIRHARLVCDVVVILCCRFIHDAFACLSLLAADAILIPRPGDCGAFRACGRSLEQMSARYQLDLAKLHFVAFPYFAGSDLSRGTLDELSGGRLAGCISDRVNRRSMKSGAVPYAAAIDHINRKEYQAIIRRMKLHRKRPDILAPSVSKEAAQCL